MNFNDPAIESPRRTRLIIATAEQIELDLSELPGLVFDALEFVPSKILPYYDVALDSSDFDARKFMIYFLHAMSGSDDDCDDLAHDLEHALDMTEPCDEHDTPCSTCCEPCFES